MTLLPVPSNVRESSGSEISGVLGQRKCNSFKLLASKVCHLAGFNLALEPSGSAAVTGSQTNKPARGRGGVSRACWGISSAQTVKEEKRNFSLFLPT